VIAPGRLKDSNFVCLGRIKWFGRNPITVTLGTDFFDHCFFEIHPKTLIKNAVASNVVGAQSSSGFLDHQMNGEQYGWSTTLFEK
jgi:hypothetical protein